MVIYSYHLSISAKSKVTKQRSQAKKEDSKLKRLVISNTGNMSRLTSLESNYSYTSSEGHLTPPAGYIIQGGPHSQGFHSSEESSLFSDTPQSSPGANSLHSPCNMDYLHPANRLTPIDYSCAQVVQQNYHAQPAIPDHLPIPDDLFERINTPISVQDLDSMSYNPIQYDEDEIARIAELLEVKMDEFNSSPYLPDPSYPNYNMSLGMYQ